MKHAKLSPGDKVMYTDLTKLAGLSEKEEEDVEKEKPPVAAYNEREHDGHGGDNHRKAEIWRHQKHEDV
jgi:hypothetical protein